MKCAMKLNYCKKNNMLNNKQKLDVLDKILKSSEFSEANKKYQDLLRYLFEASNKGQRLKETTIAIDFFKKGTDFNPGEDPTIRVRISNLRKKLDHYFLTEGKDDHVRLEIPKGHYDLEFIPVRQKQSPRLVKKTMLPYFIFVPLVLILSMIILFQWKEKKSIISNYQVLPDNNLIWGDFLKKNEFPTLIVLGDYYFFYERKSSMDRHHFIRDTRINSVRDYENFIRKYPFLAGKYRKGDLTYFRPSAVWNMAELLPILISSPNKIYLKLASELVWDDLKRHNVIFVGSYKALYIFNEFLKRLDFKYQVAPMNLYLTDDKNDTLKTYSTFGTPQGTYRKDFAISAKFHGPGNNIILLNAGFDDAAIIEIIKTISNPSFVHRLEEQFPDEKFNNPFFYELLIEVQGVNQTSFGSEIKFFKALESNFKMNFSEAD